MSRIELHPVSLARWRERYAPFICGLVMAICTEKWGYEVTDLCHAHSWHLDQIYTASFGFLAVTTGFLATFYATMQSISDGFIQKIRVTDGKTLQHFLVYTKNAIGLGFIVAVLSIPLMVATPLPTRSYGIQSTIASAWWGGTIWAVLSFYRVASLFFRLLEMRPKPKIPGG